MPQSHMHGSTPRFYYEVFSTVDTGDLIITKFDRNWLKNMRYIDSVYLFMFLEKCVIKSGDDRVDAGSEF